MTFPRSHSWKVAKLGIKTKPVLVALTHTGTEVTAKRFPLQSSSFHLPGFQLPLQGRSQA